MKNLKKLFAIALVVGLMGAVGVAYAAVTKTPAEITAAVTGQTVSEVNQERAAGQSYGAIANEAGKLDEFKAQMLEQRKALLDERIKTGTLTEEQAKQMPYNPFDLTKVWYQKDFPLIEVGVLELNRNPDNYFQDIEQAAFDPGAVVPGISFSPDKMLQGRLFSYGDAQRYRLGVNHHQIPVNSPRNASAHTSHRDGQMRVDGNAGSTLAYEPNSFGEWEGQPEYMEPPLELSGAAGTWDFRVDDVDYFTQPGKLFRLMNPEQQQVLFENTARAMGDAPEFIKLRHIGNCYRADADYGKGVANALGLSLEEAIS